MVVNSTVVFLGTPFDFNHVIDVFFNIIFVKGLFDQSDFAVFYNVSFLKLDAVTGIIRLLYLKS